MVVELFEGWRLKESKADRELGAPAAVVKSRWAEDGWEPAAALWAARERRRVGAVQAWEDSIRRPAIRAVQLLSRPRGVRLVAA